MANMAVKTMPIDESSLVRLFLVTRLISAVVSRPEIVAPISSGIGSTLLVMMNVSTTPGSTACDNASPMSAMRRNTTKQPSRPQVVPTSIVHSVWVSQRGDHGTSV